MCEKCEIVRLPTAPGRRLAFRHCFLHFLRLAFIKRSDRGITLVVTLVFITACVVLGGVVGDVFSAFVVLDELLDVFFVTHLVVLIAVNIRQPPDAIFAFVSFRHLEVFL